MNPYPLGFGNFNPAMPSSGYDGSGINPGNMYGLNHMFPQFRPQMGGNYPAQGYAFGGGGGAPMPPMMSGNDPGQHAPPMGAYGGPQQSPYGGPMMAMRPHH